MNDRQHSWADAHVRKQNRLRSNTEIRPVWRYGKRFRHSHGMLVLVKNDLGRTRFCYSASKRIGNAVKRNRAKRLMREVVRLHLDEIKDGWDCVLVANQATTAANYAAVEASLLYLFTRAKIIVTNHR
ncbi:MAG: ribonuclease P protein component [Candidatus Promineifilaceae bacterium]